MATQNAQGGVTATSGGGLSGEHPVQQGQPVLVGPTTEDQLNAVKASIIPIACWRCDDVRFAFGSSLVMPQVKEEMVGLAQLRNKHPGAPASVFGHADPVGDDDFNKRLSGRRAAAIYGMLTRDMALWEVLYSQPTGSDQWGTQAIQIMLAALTRPDPNNPDQQEPYYTGDIDGIQGNLTTTAVKDFQTDHGLTVDGVCGPNTRRELFAAYMDALCQDEQGQPFTLDKNEDFLARGQDSGGKGDYQGCSEFNPKMLFSQEEDQRFGQSTDKTERNTENALNRRVVVFLYRPGSRVSPQYWPCPRATEGVASCKKRFWSNGQERRTRRLSDQRRLFEQTEDTFACRFYHRMAAQSPCERVVPVGTIELQITLLDVDDKPRPAVAYTLKVDGRTINKKTNAKGQIIELIQSSNGQGTLVVDGEEINLDIGGLPSVQEDAGVQGRLNNLGYECGRGDGQIDEPTRKALRRFQQRHGLEASGQITPETRVKLKDIYGH